MQILVAVITEVRVTWAILGYDPLVRLRDRCINAFAQILRSMARLCNVSHQEDAAGLHRLTVQARRSIVAPPCRRDSDSPYWPSC